MRSRDILCGNHGGEDKEMYFGEVAFWYGEEYFGTLKFFEPICLSCETSKFLRRPRRFWLGKNGDIEYWNLYKWLRDVEFAEEIKGRMAEGDENEWWWGNAPSRIILRDGVSEHTFL
jgi:hypothetical protein